MEENTKVTAKKKKDDLKFWEAIEVLDIAKDLIAKDHSHLTDLPILYMFVKKMSEWGRMQLRSPKEVFISGYRFVMEVNHSAWVNLTEKQRIALVDHELCHAGYNPETGEANIIDHDVEEFGEVIKRHGFWRDDVKLFGHICHEQLDLGFSKKDAA